MRPRYYFVPLFMALIFLWSACTTVPVSGRKRLSFVPDSVMLNMSYKQYDQFLSSHKLSKDEEKIRVVKRVGKKIQDAVETYFANNNIEEQLRGYDWEFNLVQSPDVNAWCMPGGKVVVYTGILPLTKTEAGLSVVMGHEIAHAVAKHGNERMSQQLLVQMGGLTLSKAMEEEPEKTRNLWMAAFGLSAQVGFVLPYSRLHEKEADELGLIFMAMAGYDPHEAVSFWQRMANKKEGPAPPEFLSTHPADEERIKHIKDLIPQAMRYFKN